VLTASETAVERLVSLLDEHQDLSACDVLELFRAERVKARQEREQQVREMADNSLYYVARVEQVPVWFEQIGEARKLDRRVERVAVRAKDLPRFAKEYGIPLADLMNVLELRVKEVQAKGKRYQNGHPSAMFIDRSAQEDEREQFAQEDVEMYAANQTRAARRAAAGAVTAEPITKEYVPSV
jgi:hypothetical protein